MAGYDDSTILKTAYLNKVESTIQDFTIFANESQFPSAGPDVSPGGGKASWLVDYDVTNNGGLMTSITDAAPTSDSSSQVEVYQNYDYYQHSALFYDILLNQIETNRDGNKVPSNNYRGSAMEKSAKLMAADVASGMAADLLAMIDSAGNFSDAAVLRSTHNLASYEVTSVGTLTLDDPDDAIEALSTKEYGTAPRSELFFLMSTKNNRRMADLSSGGAYRELNASSDGTGNIDAGITHRVGSYDGIPIYIEDSLGDADILLLRRGTIEIFNHWAPGIKDINIAAWQEQKLMGRGANIVVKNPRYNAKLSGISG